LLLGKNTSYLYLNQISSFQIVNDTLQSTLFCAAGQSAIPLQGAVNARCQALLVQQVCFSTLRRDCRLWLDLKSFEIKNSCYSIRVTDITIKAAYHHPSNQIEVVQPFFTDTNCSVPLVKDADSGNNILRHRSRDIFIDLTPLLLSTPSHWRLRVRQY
jgi:hypothetical protein